jgi:hypothetical protein
LRISRQNLRKSHSLQNHLLYSQRHLISAKGGFRFSQPYPIYPQPHRRLPRRPRCQEAIPGHGLILRRGLEPYLFKMEAVGSRCELDLYQGEGHGFFNFRNYWRYRETVLEMDRFLVEEGFFAWRSDGRLIIGFLEKEQCRCHFCNIQSSFFNHQSLLFNRALAKHRAALAGFALFLPLFAAFFLGHNQGVGLCLFRLIINSA